jgi:hypothetical protein
MKVIPIKISHIQYAFTESGHVKDGKPPDLELTSAVTHVKFRDELAGNLLDRITLTDSKTTSTVDNGFYN